MLAFGYTSISSSHFERCTSSYQGGAVSVDGEFFISSSHFNRCTASWKGGALYSKNQETSGGVTRLRFVSCEATTSSLGTGYGGGKANVLHSVRLFAVSPALFDCTCNPAIYFLGYIFFQKQSFNERGRSKHRGHWWA